MTSSKPAPMTYTFDDGPAAGHTITLSDPEQIIEHSGNSAGEERDMTTRYYLHHRVGPLGEIVQGDRVENDWNAHDTFWDAVQTAHNDVINGVRGLGTMSITDDDGHEYAVPDYVQRVSD